MQNILIIEDQKAFSEPLAAWLTHHGIDPWVVECRDSGMDRLLEQPFSAILMDYNTRGMPADVFIDRSRLMYARMPIILMTGDPAIYEIGSRLGVTHLLRKPFQMKDLTSLLCRIKKAESVRYIA